MHIQEQSSIKSNSLAIVPTLLLISGVFVIALNSASSWLPSIIAGGFLTSIVIASLLLAPPGPTLHTAGTGAMILLSSALFLAEILTLHRNLDWVATSEPAFFLLLSGIILTTTQLQSLRRYLAAWLAIVLYIALIYFADWSGYWWIPGVLSILTFVPLALVLRLRTTEQNSRQGNILKIIGQLTCLAILASLVLGFTAFMSQQGIWQGRYGTGSAWVTGLTAMICATRQLLRTRLAIWSIASYPAILLLLLNIFFSPGPWWETLIALSLLPMLITSHILANRLPQPRRRLLDRL
jgi:hypothetical protein